MARVTCDQRHKRDGPVGEESHQDAQRERQVRVVSSIPQSKRTAYGKGARKCVSEKGGKTGIGSQESVRAKKGDRVSKSLVKRPNLRG